RPRRQAGGADIADDLSAPDMLAGAHGNTAHVAIAGAKTAAVIELHIIAVSPCTARRGDDAIAAGVDPCALSAPEIDAAVHAAVSEDRVPAHAERRGCAAVRRAHHAATLLPGARGLEPLPSPVLGPFEHRQFRLPAAHKTCVRQLAALALPGLGTPMLDND